MPPARRGRPPGVSNKPRAAPQSTLSFGRSNKITKPSVPPPSSKKASKPSENQLKDVTPAVDEEASAKEEDVAEAKAGGEVVDENTARAEEGRGIAIREREEVRNESREVDPAEEEAKRVSDAAVKRYWREKELERKAPRGNRLVLILLSLASL